MAWSSPVRSMSHDPQSACDQCQTEPDAAFLSASGRRAGGKRIARRLTRPQVAARHCEPRPAPSRPGHAAFVGPLLNVFGRLSLIALGRMAGFSLDQIGAMFGNGPAARIDRALLSDKANELGRTIRQLSALKNGLEHAAICPAPSHMECPSFRRLLKIAAARGGKSPPVRRRAGHP